jgi:dephospho-CoA kinase
MENQTLIGLTGCIGMGKSTTLKIFNSKGVMSWCADEAVTRLYSSGGQAVEYVKKISPDSVTEGFVSKEALREDVKKRPEILKKLERVVSPLLKNDRKKFLLINSKEKVLIFDLPLLFENNMENDFDITITVSVSQELQKTRVLSRNTMDETLFNLIKSKQMSDAEKRLKADYVFETISVEKTKRDIDKLLAQIGFYHA